MPHRWIQAEPSWAERPWEDEQAKGPKHGGRKPVLIGCLGMLVVVGAIAVSCAIISSNGGPKEAVANRDVATVMDEEWPLTVDEGTILCPGGGQLVFEVDGIEYALNGLAKGAGYADIEPIWRDDPDVDGLKVNIEWLISYGNTNCGY